MNENTNVNTVAKDSANSADFEITSTLIPGKNPTSANFVTLVLLALELKPLMKEAIWALNERSK